MPNTQSHKRAKSLNPEITTASLNQLVVNSTDITSPGLDYLTSITLGMSSCQPVENPNFHVILSANGLSFTQNMDEREGTYMWSIKQISQPGWFVLTWLTVFKRSLHPCSKSITSLHLLQLQNPAVTERMTSLNQPRSVNFTNLMWFHQHSSLSLYLWPSEELFCDFVPVDASKMAAGGAL